MPTLRVASALWAAGVLALAGLGHPDPASGTPTPGFYRGHTASGLGIDLQIAYDPGGILRSVAYLTGVCEDPLRPGVRGGGGITVRGAGSDSINLVAPDGTVRLEESGSSGSTTRLEARVDAGAISGRVTALVAVLNGSACWIDESFVGVLEEEAAPLRLVVSDSVVREGQTAWLQVELTGHTNPQDDASVLWQTTDGTARANSDYSFVAAWLPALLPRRQQVAIATLGDNLAEGSETFFVSFSSPHGAFAPATATVTILDDEPPGGDYLVDPRLPGYRFKVRIGGDRRGTRVANCLADTLCVAGAIPGRTEVLLRVVGPRPNGHYWPMILRFTPALVEVWVERVGSGQSRYYVLPAASDDELTGLVDREGFAAASSSPPFGAANVAQHAVRRPQPAVPPPGPYLSTPDIPDFRFKVKIGNGLATGVSPCLGETLCVAGAIPSRTEVLLRVIGPRPNGYLWPVVVRFTPSRVAVWVEQISTGTLRYYDLGAGTDDELPGLVDRMGFQP